MLNPKKNAWIQKLEAKWEKLQAGVKEKFADARIESDLEGKMSGFKKKFDEAKEATEDRVQELKDDLEASWKDVESAVGRFKDEK